MTLTDGYEQRSLHGIHALDQNIDRRARLGWGVLTGGAVTLGSGTLGSFDTVIAGSATVLANGTVYATSQTNVQIAKPAEFPRWDLIGIDQNGNVVVEQGDEDTVVPAGESAETTIQPVPPDPTGDETLAALALVWVPADTDTLDAAYIVDRRLPVNIETGRCKLHDDLTDADNRQVYDVDNSWLPTERYEGVDTSDSGTLELSATAYNFTTGIEVDRTGENTADVRLAPDATGTVTLSTGGAPAFSGAVGVAGLTETDHLQLSVAPNTADQVAADYAFSYEFARTYTTASDTADVDLTVTWETDPGSDLTVQWAAFIR